MSFVFESMTSKGHEEVVFCSKCVMSNQRPQSVVEFKNNDNQKSGLKIDSN